ncbi:unannotated protein [freshwater metagenome]|uniref:Unannotated protein n=1 Tax=freshwater metagenome TaxID=449393 RepID=A0A6J7GZ93_9ZZZZ|nr:hypothetical protein [Actinomycetota bacterium]
MTRAPKRLISITLSLLIALYGSVAQSQPASAAVLGADFTVTVSDLQFILQQIRIAESHRALETNPVADASVVPSTNVLTAGRQLTDPGSTTTRVGGRNVTVPTVTVTALSTTVLSPLLPEGLRQVDGRNNNLTQNGFSSWMGFGYITPNPLAKSAWGAADTLFPRLVPPAFRTVNVGTADEKNYSVRTGNVIDAAPRVISNLISDQSIDNPAARAAASCTVPGGANPCVASNTDGKSLFIANRATNGVAAPYNGMFALFGQFFDHGLDLVGKSSSSFVKVPLASTDPLYNKCMNLSTTQGCITEISMGRTDFANGDPTTTAGLNTTTPWIDQNQTYTSHPSHQVFLREYYCRGLETLTNVSLDIPCTSTNPPIATGKLLDGINGNIANWAEVKLQAANKLGIRLVDMDIHEVPLLLTDEYGRFLRSSTGFPQVVTATNGTTATVSIGNPVTPVSAGLGTGHAFLNDIAHFAAPASNLRPTTVAGVVSNMTNGMPDAGYYDNALLEAHFITGDGRGNENIGLTAVHTIFHAEHNRLWSYLQGVITGATTGSTGLTTAQLNNFKDAWKLTPGGQWNGERLFHASKLITEMEYQHLVFGEFARKVQPLIKPFVAYDPTIRPDISGEFAHAVYRYGHSQLNETVDRTSVTGAANDMKVPLLYAFLNPTEFNQPHDYYTNPRIPTAIGAPLTGAQAAGSIVRGMSRQTGNEIDEFVTGALRNSLLGLPLDLATLNIARGRDAGIPSLNSFRRTVNAQTGITSLAPYDSWVEFGQSLRHPESLVNFVAAYGTTNGPIEFLDASTVNPTDTISVSLDAADNTIDYTLKRAAAQSIVDCYEMYHGVGNETCEAFMVGNSGLEDVDMWIGGLAENNTQAGTMLGSTFDYVFKKQLEKLQESDRFYYLGRLAGLNLTVQVETNFFSDIIMRNTDVTSITTDAFAVPTYTVNMATAAPSFIKVVNGVWIYTGTGHVLWNGTNPVVGVAGSGNDKILSDRGDDSIYGAGGNDWLRGGDGNDFIQGGEGNDVIEDSAGANILIGGNGNDYMSGSGTDAYNGNGGDDFIFGGTFPVVGLAGIGNDWLRGGSDNDILSGDDGNDWLEGAEGSDLVDGDVVGAAGITLAFPGSDVLIGGTGNDLISGFDGADIYVPGDGTDLNTGGLGFDWATYYNDGQVGGVNEDLSNFAPAPGLVLANLADQFQEIEGLSGSDENDVLFGSALTTLGGAASNGLATADCALITGLPALLPTATCAWNGGDILIGGGGSDVITGGNGADLIDGNAVLQTWISVPASWTVQNEAPAYVNTGGRKYVASMSTIRKYIADNLITTDVIADLRIVRLIVQVPSVPGENDVAVYQAPRANYTIAVNPTTGIITVTDPRNGGGVTIDGVDSLRNIETLRFTDGELVVSSIPSGAPTLAAAGARGGVGTIAVTWTAPTVTGGAPLANYTARAWTSNLRAGTPAGTCTTADATLRTCTITGLAAGAYFVDVVATTTTPVNSAPSAIVAVSPTVTAPVAATLSLSTASIAVTQNTPITATTVSTTGFTGTITYSIAGALGAQLPTGIDFFTSTGVLSGTPSTTLASTPFTITATDGTRSATASINIAVTAPGAATLSLSTASITGTVNTPITSTTVSTTGFTGTIAYSISGGTLPAGINFSTITGVLSGTPSAAQGITSFTVTATDASNATASATIDITVAAAAPAPANGPLTAPASVTVSAANGSAVIVWSAVPGASRYTAQAFSSNTSTTILRQCSVTANANGSSFSCTIPRLQSRSTYYVEVVVRNATGAISTPSRIRVTVL